MVAYPSASAEEVSLSFTNSKYVLLILILSINIGYKYLRCNTILFFHSYLHIWQVTLLMKDGYLKLAQMKEMPTERDGSSLMIENSCTMKDRW